MAGRGRGKGTFLGAAMADCAVNEMTAASATDRLAPDPRLFRLIQSIQ
jgi:hypothetical protein